MARYIDADKLIEKYERVMKDPWNKSSAPSSWASALECVIADIDDIPTVAVVPKSEVSILTVQNMALENTKCKLQHELNKYKGVENILKDNMGELIMAAIVQAKQELASEIFAEIENLFLNNHIESFQNFHDNWIYRFKVNMMTEIAELKKKYVEETK